MVQKSSQKPHHFLATMNRTSGYTPSSLAAVSMAVQAFSSMAVLCSEHCVNARWISLGFSACA